MSQIGDSDEEALLSMTVLTTIVDPPNVFSSIEDIQQFLSDVDSGIVNPSSVSQAILADLRVELATRKHARDGQGQ